MTIALPSALSALTLGFLGCILAATPVAAQDAALEILDIHTAKGTVHFSVEVMKTPQELERGLMFRKYMPAERGMIFDFGREQPVMMWMKNTYIPLDMLFASADGTIISIAENAEPLSETIIPSGGPVKGVVELNAGSAAQFGIAKGDKITASIFAPASQP